ncbi:MAG TPA: Shedu immune nuclease family protein [Candidatus Paceibacterota bacterium]|nr:Shedu immune nuclease family protein [Candidatus Paceibacterota bacterium]
MDITDRFFVVASDISIFKKIAEVVSEDIYIGGDAPTSLPESEFRKLLKDFPNPYEVKKYVHARIGSVLSNYYDSASDVEEKYDRYMNKRKSVKSEDLLEEFKQDELVKYQTLLDRLQVMLERETAYNEKQWQNEILDIILLLYPKYLFAFKEAPVRDAYNEKDRQLDFLLVDANGSIDIVEIKRPLGKQIITQGKYRDNHIPLRDLSGTVMQIEKYIFHLNKSGKKGEEKLTEKYKDKLPKDFKIKIINPCGMIIMGRDNDLSTAQKEDLEVVKRKYKSVIDIITYDDLLRRLKAMIAAIKKR